MFAIIKTRLLIQNLIGQSPYLFKISHSILNMGFEVTQNMYRLKGKQPQPPKPFILIDIRKCVL